VGELSYEIIKPKIGATVHVDRNALLEDESVARQCLMLLEQRGVPVFPELDLSDAEQLAFTDRLGQRVNFVQKAPGGMAAQQDIYKITLDPTINDNPGYVLGTFFWHMDGVVADDIPPPKATLLSARKLAANGGDTEFASTRAAYTDMPEAQKAEIDHLRVQHSVDAAVRMILEDGQAWAGPHTMKNHPLVWRRQNGERSLVIGSTADRIAGLPLAQGRAILARLLEWTAQPDFTYCHRWREGDFVIWDNTGTLHRVKPYDCNSGRIMHRTSIAGTEMVQ
jgi:alpha-ketoglutarate-dependent taurine dioxygenase